MLKTLHTASKQIIILRAFLALAACSMLPAPSAHAQYFWDSNGATAGFGTAAGTWAAPTTGDSTQGWSTSGTGVLLPGNVTTLTSDSINFGNGTTGLGAGTITVSGSVASGNMTFASGSGAIVLSGGTITLSDTQTTSVNNGTNTIGSVVAGAATSLTKNGSGTLVLAGNNTYTGNTTISAGVLRITNGSALGTTTGGTSVTTSVASLEIDGSGGDVSVGAEPISIQTGGLGDFGTIRNIAGNNTLAGVVTLAGASRIGSDAGTLTLTNSVTAVNHQLILAGAGNITISGNITTGTGNLVRAAVGGGLSTLSGVNTYTGVTRIGGGTLSVGTIGDGGVAGNMGAASNAADRISLGNGGTLRYTGSTASTDRAFTLDAFLTANANIEITAAATNLTMSGGSAGTTGGLAKIGAGTLTLSGANLYSGATSVDAGTLLINGSTAAGSAFAVNNAGTLGGTGTIGGTVTLNSGGTLSPGASIESLASGSNTWNGNSSFTFEFDTDGSTGSAGANWDLLSITGGLDLTGASSGNPVNFNLVTMANTTTPGALASWDQTMNHTWLGFVTTTTGFTAFAADKFSITTTGFQNPIAGTFSIAQNGNNLDLVYVAVPEPGTLALVGLGLVSVWMLGRVAIPRYRAKDGTVKGTSATGGRALDGF